MSPPREVKATSRSERNTAIQASAQAYANALEEIVRQHPFQWYIFEDFFRSDHVIKENPIIGKIGVEEFDMVHTMMNALAMAYERL